MRSQYYPTAPIRISPGRQGAFTLVELILSVTIMGILMTGLASAIVIVTYAVPSDESPAIMVVEATEVSDQIVEELRTAIWITEHSATAVAFTVADRDGDHVPERIRYEWSGTPGDPLMREYNGGAAIAVLENVRDIALSYEIVSVSEEYPGPPVESSEVLLSSYTGAADLKNFSIDQDKWIGQYFEPSLPGDALDWRVTKVEFEAKERGATDGETLVQLRPADPNNLPTDTVLEQYTMYESDLGGSYAWREFNFSNAGGLTPGDGLCLVLQFVTADNHSANIRYDDDWGAGRLDTEDGGGSWDIDSDRAMRHGIYGTYSTPGPPRTATRYYVTSIQLALQVGDESPAYLVTAAQTLNTPELLSAMWETDFKSDPTLDHNGDGHPDWEVRGGGVFNTGSLVDGVWDADAKLDTYPDNDLVTLTTAEVRLRSTSVGDAGAVFRINADWNGSLCASLVARVQLQADDTQVALISHMLDSMSETKLVMVSGLPDDFVTIRLLIDPILDTVNVKVAGEDRGTYTYATIVPAENLHSSTIYADGGSAEFDYVSIRVSE